MNKIFVISFFLLASLGFGQFNIKGEIKGYSKQPVYIKIYEEGSKRLVERVETNNDGVFNYRLPKEYIGILTFDLSGGSFEVVSDNKDISFTTDFNDPNHKFIYKDGVNVKLEEYNTIEQLYDLRDNTLKPLLSLYESTDKFYDDILKEISRINHLSLPEFNDDNINYYLQLKSEIGKPISTLQTVKSHLVNDDERLEKFGYLVPVFSEYISKSIGENVSSREEISKNIDSALDTLLKEVVVETPRGQNILSTAIAMFGSYGFDNLANKYTELASGLTCEMTGDLKRLLSAKENIKVGKLAPNIKLNGTKVKSLYDVKADKKLVVFWASWCPHCMRELPNIIKFYPEFKKSGGEIVAISLDVEKDKFDAATKNLSWINYTDLMKWDSPIVELYGVKGTPSMFLLDKDNKILKIGSRVFEFQ